MRFVVLLSCLIAAEGFKPAWVDPFQVGTLSLKGNEFSVPVSTTDADLISTVWGQDGKLGFRQFDISKTLQWEADETVADGAGYAPLRDGGFVTVAVSSNTATATERRSKGQESTLQLQAPDVEKVLGVVPGKGNDYVVVLQTTADAVSLEVVRDGTSKAVLDPGVQLTALSTGFLGGGFLKSGEILVGVNTKVVVVGTDNKETSKIQLPDDTTSAAMCGRGDGKIFVAYKSTDAYRAEYNVADGTVASSPSSLGRYSGAFSAAELSDGTIVFTYPGSSKALLATLSVDGDRRIIPYTDINGKSDTGKAWYWPEDAPVNAAAMSDGGFVLSWMEKTSAEKVVKVLRFVTAAATPPPTSVPSTPAPTPAPQFPDVAPDERFRQKGPLVEIKSAAGFTGVSVTALTAGGFGVGFGEGAAGKCVWFEASGQKADEKSVSHPGPPAVFPTGACGFGVIRSETVVVPHGTQIRKRAEVVVQKTDGQVTHVLRGEAQYIFNIDVVPIGTNNSLAAFAGGNGRTQVQFFDSSEYKSTERLNNANVLSKADVEGKLVVVLGDATKQIDISGNEVTLSSKAATSAAVAERPGGVVVFAVQTEGGAIQVRLLPGNDEFQITGTEKAVPLSATLLEDGWNLLLYRHPAGQGVWGIAVDTAQKTVGKPVPLSFTSTAPAAVARVAKGFAASWEEAGTLCTQLFYPEGVALPTNNGGDDDGSDGDGDTDKGNDGDGDTDKGNSSKTSPSPDDETPEFQGPADDTAVPDIGKTTPAPVPEPLPSDDDSVPVWIPILIAVGVVGVLGGIGFGVFSYMGKAQTARFEDMDKELAATFDAEPQPYQP